MKNSFLILILCAASAIQIAQAEPSTSAPAHIPPTDVVNSYNLPNFHEVHDYLYRGGKPTPKGLLELKKMGIATVIDLRNHSRTTKDETIAKKLGMNFLNLPMSDQAPTKAEINTFLKTVENAQQKHRPVFVHCAHGSDRTGCMVGLWRVTHDNWNYNKAYEEMLKYYFNPKFTNLSETVARYSK